MTIQKEGNICTCIAHSNPSEVVIVNGSETGQATVNSACCLSVDQY